MAIFSQKWKAVPACFRLEDLVDARNEALCFWLADRITVSSDHDFLHLRQTNPSWSDKCSIVRNFVDVDLFKPNKFHKKANRRIVFVGRLNSQNLSILSTQ